MKNVLRFELHEAPLAANNLYANGKPIMRKGKSVTPRFQTTAVSAYKQRVLDAALDAADAQGWDLAYDGPASVRIIVYRKKSQGADWDGVPKAIQDALQPELIENDREVWDGRVLIVSGSEKPHVTVIVERTTREAIAAQAALIERTFAV